MSYEPTHPGASVVAEWLYRELLAVSAAMGLPTHLVFDVLSIEPVRPQDGMVAYADGSGWNPGDGEGFYAYINGAWEILQTGAAAAGTQVGLVSQLPANDLYPMDDFGNPSYKLATAVATSSVTLWPVFFDADGVFDGLQYHVNASHASEVVDFNLYEFLGNGKPGPAVVAVNLPVTATGVQSVAFAATSIAAGWYLAGVHKGAVGSPTFRGIDTSGFTGSWRQVRMLVTDPFSFGMSASEMTSRVVADATLPGGSYTLGGDLTGLVMTTANSTDNTAIPTIMFVKA